MRRLADILVTWLVVATAGLAPVSARAAGPQQDAGERNQPVNFTADEVQYDREAGIVTATGNVEAWQNDRTLRADKIVFNRETGVAAATGHVVIQEADGQVLFSDYAELTRDMKDGVLAGMRAQLSQNGRLAANGARRTDARLNELSRAIYSTCNLCAQDPTRAPLWAIRARQAIQDVDNKRIEYRDAVVEIYGIPVIYLPYLTHPDPSQKRATGLLVPSFGSASKHLGAYVIAPYNVVINDQSDVLLTPIVTAKAGQALEFNYRQRFNNGNWRAVGSVSDENSKFNGHLFTRGDFALSDVWRWGFDINAATSASYVRDFRIAPNAPDLASTVFLEGFGQGSYSRLDTRFYQSLNTANVAEKLPFVLPRYEYSFVGQPDSLGGRTNLEAGAFYVVRTQGTTTQRANLGLGWNRPFNGPVGDLWNLALNVDSAAYNAHGLSQLPNYVNLSDATSAQAMPTASLDFHWPFQRDAGGWGTQVIEPIAKMFISPQNGSYSNGRIPNEDSLDLEFTDATLFERNRYQGYDRLEGGVRGALGLRAQWMFPGGAQIDGMVGQSYRAKANPIFTEASGLRDKVSDVVARQTFTPNAFLDITARERFNNKTFNVRFADAIATAGPEYLRVSAGYVYSYNDPFSIYDQPPTTTRTAPRSEVAAGISTHYGSWRLSAETRHNVELGKIVAVGAVATYEDECFIFNARFFKRYTSQLGDSGDTGLLFTITLKTVGEFGFHAN